MASGLIHNYGASDEAALDLVRAYLSYFPSSAWDYPAHVEGGDDGYRLIPEVLDVVPRNGRQVYDMRHVVDIVFDEGSAFEVQPGFGTSVLTFLARLGGHPVAVVANQPMVLAGSVSADGADKAAHFMNVADSFHLPLIFLSDNPGVMPGSASEQQAILRSGARMYAAQASFTAPKLTVTLRKAYGFGSMVMGMIPFDGQSGVYNWPGVTSGAMGAAAMSRSRGSDVDEAEMLRAMELEASYNSARSFGGDELIDPRDTRNVLLQSLERALHRRQVGAGAGGPRRHRPLGRPGRADPPREGTDERPPPCRRPRRCPAAHHRPARGQERLARAAAPRPARRRCGPPTPTPRCGSSCSPAPTRCSAPGSTSSSSSAAPTTRRAPTTTRPRSCGRCARPSSAR